MQDKCRAGVDDSDCQRKLGSKPHGGPDIELLPFQDNPVGAAMQKKWTDLSSKQRRGITIAGIVQVALAAWAWIDLARRPADRVAGRKPLWAAVIAINFAGPAAYWRWGRTQRG